MARYLAVRPCFVEGVLREPGEVVETAAPPGRALVALPEGESRGEDRPAPPGLAGSNTLPERFVLVDGSALALSDIVLIAFKQSGLSAGDWNGLTESERDAKLAALAADFGWRNVGGRPAPGPESHHVKSRR